MISSNEKVFLSALRDGLRGKTLESDPGLIGEDWAEVLKLAKAQELLPLVYEAVYRCESFSLLNADKRREFQNCAVSAAVRQIVQGNEFLTLLLRAQAQGLDPAVIKGSTLRSLYPKPMLRPSVDEDLLISSAEAERLHRFFLSEGLEQDEPEAEPSTATELSYHKPDSPTYIELHTSLFPPDASAYGDCNALFEGVMDRTVRMQIEDVFVCTLAPTDHLLYLICHAYKHFLHSGVGIRQVCDLAVLADKCGAEIDWLRVRLGCESLRIAYFAAALFRIAEKHLGYAMPEAFAALDVDEGPLLADILSGGNLGTADIDRMHSGNMTLDAVAAQKQRRKRGGLRASLFPSAAYMTVRYPWLRGRKWLLPAAWVWRLLQYLLRRGRKAAAGLQIGRERIELLKRYKIID